MPEFLRLLPPNEARALLMSHLASPGTLSEQVDATVALGRVTAEDILAPHALPQFARSSVDGYAVRAGDTHGASDSAPAYLQIAGEVDMGAAPGFVVKPGQCAEIQTGGMLPEGSDAVVMLEYAQRIGRPATVVSPSRRRDEGLGNASARADPSLPAEIEVLKAVAGGENVIHLGEDVSEGQIVIYRGIRLRPADIGGLAALGITELRVAKRPRVALISSGDEIVNPRQVPRLGQVRDVNAHSLASLVSEFGGLPEPYGIVADEMAAVRQVTARALQECDVLLMSGGSSASARDLTANAIAYLGKPGVLVHGIQTRPGKPTILAVCDGKAVIGLPGNPVSALVIGYLFVVPVLERLLGLPPDRPRPSVPARLAVNVPSQAGREDWWPVRLRRKGQQNEEWLAEPVFGKSNLIFSLAAAHGLICIPADANGVSMGDLVDVYLM
jgi:molybdopterin molybdotransferase